MTGGRVAGALACVLAFAHAARAEKRLSPAAKAHMDRALAEYEAHHYDAAVIEFQAAYAIEPRREILFAWGQAERLRGNCAHALTLYREFLALSPPDDEAARARERITECERAVAHPAEPSPAHGPEPSHGGEPSRPLVGERSPQAGEHVPQAGEHVPQAGEHVPQAGESPPGAERPPAAELPRPWYRDRVTAGLVGGGAVVAAAGGVALALSQRHVDAGSYGSFASDAQLADHEYTFGIVGLVAGGALVGAGIVHAALAGPPSRPATVSVIVTPRAVSVMARF